MTTDVAQKGGGMSAFIANTTRKAYDKETFASLVECCSRLFCCDEEIVITDLLLAAEKAVTERDVEAELGISERRVHEFMVRLERHGLVNKVTMGQTADILVKPQRQTKSTRDVLPAQPASNAQSYWRLSSYLIIAVHYKLSRMEAMLQQRRQSLYECDRFLCPGCNAVYDSLEVQKLEMDGFDAHFICYCGSKVELDDRAAKESIYSSQQQRCEEQVKTLKKCLTAAWGMEVPHFPLYIRNKDKGTDKGSDAQATDIASSTVGESSVVSGCSGTSDESNSTTMRPAAKSLLSDIGKQPKMAIGGRGETGKIKFHMRGSTSKQHATTNGTSRHVKLDTELSVAAGLKEVTKATEETTAPQLLQETTGQDEGIMFHIKKLGRSFSLAEAQNHQQHMNNEEFEKFLELQDTYLNFL